MASKISKFLITLVCAFCIAFCGVSAKQPQQEQSFNVIIRETLASNPDIKVPTKFQSVAFKTIVQSETTKYSTGRSEFNGTSTLKDMFGDDKQKKKFDTTFVYLSNQAPIIAKANTTWYLMHEYPNGRGRFRLYYQKNLVAVKPPVFGPV